MEFSTEALSNIEEISSEAVSEAADAASSFGGQFVEQFMAFINNFGNLDVDKLVEVLKTMGMGMLGIFAVTIIIILVVSLLNKSTSMPKKKKEDKE